MASIKQALNLLGTRALDMAFPPRCPSCNASVAAEGNFCTACFGQLKMIAPPLCSCCGIPFAAQMGDGALCPECLVTLPSFDKARAVMVYDRISAPLVAALKFRDQWAGLPRYATMMKASGAALFDGVDMIIPVPLHWRRLLTRKYNQAALLAYQLAEEAGLPCRLDILRRIHATVPQMRLDRATRLKNVRKAFALSPRANVRDKVLLLVDDVVTTGATVDACAALLKKAGAAEVRVLALARTVKE